MFGVKVWVASGSGIKKKTFVHKTYVTTQLMVGAWMLE